MPAFITNFLNAIAILSGIITIITGSITLISYFQRKPVSPSQPDRRPTTQPTLPHQVTVPSSQQYTQPPLSYSPTAQQLSQKRNRLSYPKIALIALIGQVFLFVGVSIFTAGAFDYILTYSSNPSGTSEENFLAIISIVLAGSGLVCALTALVMSLIKTKQLRRWGWFAGLILGFIGFFILCLPALIPLLFGIFGPREQRAAETQTVLP